MLPLTFLTWDPAQPKLMREPPRNPEDHIFDKTNVIDLAWAGFTMGAIGYTNFILLFVRENVPLNNIDPANPFYMRATTLTYISIVFVQWMNILSRRVSGYESVFTSYIWSNQKLILAYLISFIFLFNIVYNPFISVFLRTAPLTLLDWIYALAGGILYLFIRETYKILRKKKTLLRRVFN
jgi:P-type Ca2+ transporter type 2C